MYRLMVLVLLAATAPLYAQTSPCGDQDTTLGARQCYASELNQAEKDMQAALDHVLANYSPSEENLKGLKGDSREKQRQWYARMQQQVRASQTAFLAYRDSTCSIFDVEYEGGTLRPVAVLACRVELTKQRAKWLRDSFQDEGD